MKAATEIRLRMKVATISSARLKALLRFEKTALINQLFFVGIFFPRHFDHKSSQGGAGPSGVGGLEGGLEGLGGAPSPDLIIGNKGLGLGYAEDRGETAVSARQALLHDRPSQTVGDQTIARLAEGGMV